MPRLFFEKGMDGNHFIPRNPFPVDLDSLPVALHMGGKGKSGLKPASLQNFRGHGGGGTLAVGSGNMHGGEGVLGIFQKMAGGGHPFQPAVNSSPLEKINFFKTFLVIHQFLFTATNVTSSLTGAAPRKSLSSF